ncbi:MAG TPA: hypothetical protein VIL32_04190 [Steroidobacteraceae bacterium]
MKDLAPTTRSVILVLWCSFLAAAAATMVCFGLLDPMAADPDAMPGWWTSRRTVYALGFFFLWATAAAAAGLVLYMTRTEAR